MGSVNPSLKKMNRVGVVFYYKDYFFFNYYISVVVMARKYKKRISVRKDVRARHIARFKQRVKNIIRSTDESRYINNNIGDATPVLGTGTITLLSGVGIGSGDTYRNGAEVKITSIEGRCFIQQDATPVGSESCFRMILVRAKINLKGVAPAITDILDSEDIWSLRNVDGQSDYKVYLDKTWTLNQNLANQTLVKPYHFYKRLGGLKATFDGDGATIASAEAGHWFLIRMSDDTADNNPYWNIELRTRFKEL